MRISQRLGNLNNQQAEENPVGLPAETHRAQIGAILEAWGMPRPNAGRTAEVMTWADLRGIGSHGISMLLNYDILRENKKVTFAAEPTILRETPVSALVDDLRIIEKRASASV